MNRLIMLLLGCSLLGTIELAAAVDSRGSRSCAAWLDHRSQQPDGHALYAEVDQTWLVGYLSGVVAGSGIDFLAGTDNESIYKRVDEYCQANPLGQLAAAGNVLARELMVQKGMSNIPTLR